MRCSRSQRMVDDESAGGVQFFFSSRRRHTRYIGDWSSDVCSSDLCSTRYFPPILRGAVGGKYLVLQLPTGEVVTGGNLLESEIGRASCRERVYMYVGAVSCKQKRC